MGCDTHQLWSIQFPHSSWVVFLSTNFPSTYFSGISSNTFHDWHSIILLLNWAMGKQFHSMQGVYDVTQKFQLPILAKQFHLMKNFCILVTDKGNNVCTRKSAIAARVESINLFSRQSLMLISKDCGSNLSKNWSVLISGCSVFLYWNFIFRRWIHCLFTLCLDDWYLWVVLLGSFGWKLVIPGLTIMSLVRLDNLSHGNAVNNEISYLKYVNQTNFNSGLFSYLRTIYSYSSYQMSP